MAGIYYENLSPEIKKGMKELKYSEKELEMIYAAIIKRRENLIKGFKRAAIIMGIVLGVILLLTITSLGKMPNPTVGIIAILITVVICGVILVFLRFVLVDRVRNQFISRMKKYYPQYMHLVEKKTEEK